MRESCSYFFYRYASIMSEAVAELIPDFRTREAILKDSLDIFIDHRLQSARMFEEQMHGQDQDGTNRPPGE